MRYVSLHLNLRRAKYLDMTQHGATPTNDQMIEWNVTLKLSEEKYSDANCRFIHFRPLVRR